ncbi:SDR family oxidoreductase [Arthrobacter monumenti]
MERILVAGGTGLAGRDVVTEALKRGYQVRVLSRRIPTPDQPAFRNGVEYVRADVVSGEGLSQALDGVDVVIDTLDGRTGKARKLLPTGAAKLTATAAEAGIKRVVLLSIVNVDQGPLAYYRAKAAQERAYSNSAAHTVIVRAAQFHNLVAGMACAASKARLFISLRGVSFQPIATTDVARALLDSATAAGLPDGGMVTVGGPEVIPAREVAEVCRNHAGGKGRIITVPVPGRVGRFFREGRMLTPGNSFGTVTFKEWLELRQAPNEANRPADS